MSGGAERDRTADLLIANETLSQLSYGPTEGRARIVASPSGLARHAEENFGTGVRPGICRLDTHAGSVPIAARWRAVPAWGGSATCDLRQLYAAGLHACWPLCLLVRPPDSARASNTGIRRRKAPQIPCTVTISSRACALARCSQR